MCVARDAHSGVAVYYRRHYKFIARAARGGGTRGRIAIVHATSTAHAIMINCAIELSLISLISFEFDKSFMYDNGERHSSRWNNGIGA